MIFSGCGAIKNSLKPWVCDCDAQKLACDDGSVPKVVEADPEGGDDSDGDDPIGSDDGPSDEERMRIALLESNDWIQDDARRELNEQSIKELESQFGLDSELSSEDRVFVGTMARKSPAALAIFKANQKIEVIVESGRDAERDWAASVAPRSFVESITEPAVAGRMVDDGRLELVIQEVLDTESGPEVHLAVYKVIGVAVARVFGHPIARKDKAGEWQTTHEIRILNGEKARWIEVRPAGSEDDPDRYRWNHWEGMFRIPRPVPTAPGRSPVKPPADEKPVSALIESSNRG